MTNQLIPVIPTSHLYVNGLQMTPNNPALTGLIVAPGSARDQDDMIDMVLPDQGAFIDPTVRGVNGLDSGTLAANSVYAVYLIGDAAGYNPTAAMISLLTNNPYMPVGYTSFRRIGWMFTGGGAAIIPFATYGEANVKRYSYYIARNVLTGGNATIFTSVSLGATIPPSYLLNGIGISPLPLVNATLTAAVAGDVFAAVPSAITGVTLANAYARGSASVAGVAQVFPPFQLPSSFNGSFDYRVTQAGDALTVNVVGFDDFIL